MARPQHERQQKGRSVPGRDKKIFSLTPRRAQQSPQYQAEVKNEWSYASTVPCVQTAPQKIMIFQVCWLCACSETTYVTRELTTSIYFRDIQPKSVRILVKLVTRPTHTISEMAERKRQNKSWSDSKADTTHFTSVYNTP